MLAIYKREFKYYFYSMTGSIFIAFLTFMTGIYFMAYVRISGGDSGAHDAEFFRGA